MRDVEAGGANQRVDRALAAVGGDDAVRRDALDGVGDQLDVRPHQRRVEIVRVDDALAAERIRGSQAQAQRLIAHLLPAVRPGRCQQRLAGQRALVETAAAPFEHLGPVPPDHRRIRRKVRQQPIDAGVEPVAPRHDPVGGALEHVQLLRLFGDRRHQLRRGRPGADHRDALAGHRVVVVPARRMQALSLEVVQTRDVRPARLAQRPGAAHEEARAQGVSAFGGQLPVAAGFVEARLGDARAEADVREQPEARGYPLHVGLDLGCAGETAGPVRVGREGERIHRRRHVDMGARIGVVPPGAAESVLLFEDHEVVDAGALELDRRAQPRHAGAEDHHLVVRRGRPGCSGGHRQRLHHEAGDSLDRLVGAAQHAAVGLEHMPAVCGDLAARLDPGRLQRGFELQRLAVQQFVRAGLDQRRRQAAQFGEQRRHERRVGRCGVAEVMRGAGGGPGRAEHRLTGRLGGGRIAHRDIHPRRQQHQRGGPRRAAIAQGERGRQRQPAAGRIAGQHDRATIGAQHAKRRNGVVEPGRKSVLRREPVVEREHRQPGHPRQPRGQRPVRGRRADAVRSAVQIQHDTRRRRWCAQRSQPFAVHAADLSRLDRHALRHQRAARQAAQPAALEIDRPAWREHRLQQQLQRGAQQRCLQSFDDTAGLVDDHREVTLQKGDRSGPAFCGISARRLRLRRKLIHRDTGFRRFAGTLIWLGFSGRRCRDGTRKPPWCQ